MDAKYICDNCQKEFLSKKRTPSVRYCCRECHSEDRTKKYDYDRAIELYQSGMGQREVAERMGVATSTIWTLLVKRGVERRISTRSLMKTGSCQTQLSQ